MELRLDNVMLNIVVLLQWTSQQEKLLLLFMRRTEIMVQMYPEILKLLFLRLLRNMNQLQVQK